MRTGRFSDVAAEIAQRYSQSVSFDWRLYRHDIAGSIAHAAALAHAGILTSEEREKIDKGLREIETEIENGKFEWDQSLEDVHMNIEAALTKRIGVAGAKLHTARSRNDQAALDLRLYVKAEIGEIRSGLRSLQSALLHLAEQHIDVVMPGYTSDCLTRTDVLPLGAGALAGSTIVLNRTFVAGQLGFSSVSQNSIDAVGDRDFVAEFLFCLAMIGLHLSRLSEDLIIWSTNEFGFVEFSDAFSTGSSLMPQKKNPDMAELTRGKTGRLYGNLMSILTTVKALPSSYNRDLQEDKYALFDSVDTVKAALEVFAAMLPELTVNRERMERAASDPNLLATDLAEYLVKKGMPFREAHEVVGKLIARASEKNVALDNVSLLEMQEASPLFWEDVTTIFDARRSLEKRGAIGAPSPENVAARIKHWRALLDPTVAETVAAGVPAA